MMRLLTVALCAGSATAYAVEGRRRLSYTSILGYQPGTAVDDHARIDLDQSQIMAALSTPDYLLAKGIYETGIFSKPSAICTVGDAGGLPNALSKGDLVYYETAAGEWHKGYSHTGYAAGATSFTMNYEVPEDQIIYDYAGKKPTALTSACWVGDGTTTSTVYSTTGCLAKDANGVAFVKVQNLPDANVTGCTTGNSGGFGTCLTGWSAPVNLSSCVNHGKRTLKGFSTAAKKKMYDPTLTSPDCPTKATSPYVSGCPYTSYVPYWDYYCSSATSPCNAKGDYAHQIILGALDKSSTPKDLTNGGMDFTVGTGKEDAARVQFVKKGTAYLSAWMYAIREFEDAIDDCKTGTPTNEESTKSVHAWDEGVAFYMGSVMRNNAEMFSRPDGFLAYTLGNKRCENYKTCGLDGNVATTEQSQQNSKLMALFTEGQQKLFTGDCAGAVPIKDQIVQWMTIPLVQGTMRYAHKLATSSTAGAKEHGEGAIFAAGVLPQVAACDKVLGTTHAKTINDNMNINTQTKTQKYPDVKKAFEACYAQIFPDIADPCAAVGGLWSGGKYLNAGEENDASPCPSPAAAGSGELGGGAIAGIAIGAGLAVIFLLCMLYLISKESAGKPVFTPTAGAGAKA